MQSLNDEELLNVIEEYILSDSEYAMLIDGEWGSGKTYFAENKLVEHLKKLKESETITKECIYVSLYGVTSKQEIENQITEKILEQSSEKYGKFLSRGFKNSKTLSNIINIATPDGIKNIFGEIDIEKIISKFQNVEEQILIFDDLERVEMDYNEVFGFINDYVEHKENKCIIFVNQSEIQKNNIMKNIELKYLTAEVMNKFNITEKQKSDGKVLDKELLTRDVADLYSDDLSYKKIKEKIIGKEIKYIPNITEVCKKLAAEMVKEAKAKEILINCASTIEKKMQRAKHCNIRTLKLIIEKFETIVIEIGTSEIKDIELYEAILKDILIALLSACIRKKKYDEINTWNNNVHYISGNHPEFRFIDNFIMTEKLDTQYMIETLKEYNEILKQENEDSNNEEIRYLRNYYAEMEDAEIKEKLQIIQKKLEDNNYNITLYPRILLLLLAIDNLKLTSFNFEEYFNLMKENIKKNPGIKKLHTEMYLTGEVDSQKYYEYINQLKEMLTEEQKNKRILGMNSIINGEKDWGNKLREYLEQYSDHENNFFIKEVDIENLIEIFKVSDAKDIYKARIIFQNSKINEEDYEKIKSFVEMLENLIENETRATQRLNFIWLRDNLKKWLEENQNEER